MLRKGMGLALAALLAGGSLAACGDSAPPVPSPKAATSSGSRPAASIQNFARISKRVLSAVNANDKDLTTDKLAQTTVGPMTVIRGAQYNTRRLLGDSYPIVSLATDVKKNQVAISAAKGYPRLSMAVMDPVKGTNLPALNVFSQGGARENWRLWGTLEVLPKAEFPSIEGGKTGAEFISADSGKGLVASPKQVIEGYVNLNQTRTDGKGLNFAEDSVRKALQQDSDKNNSSVSGAGKATMTFAVGDNGPVALRTSDGGAVVVAQMNYFTTMSSDSGHTVTVGGPIGGIATGKAGGKVKLDGNTLTASSTLLVAFKVPAAKAKDKTISVIASGKSVTLSAKVQ